MTHINLRLIGGITLLSPLTITLPGSRDTVRADEPSPVPSMTIYREGMGYVDTGYVPASSVRGTLRRAAHAALQARLQHAGAPLTDLRSFYMHRIGGIKSKGTDGLTRDVTAEIELRQRNPFISLFGAADAGAVEFLGGRLEVDHGLPQEPIAPDRCPAFPGMRSDDLLRATGETNQFLDDNAYSDWEAMFAETQNTSEIKKQIKARKRDVMTAKSSGDAAQARAISDEIRELESKAGGQRSSIAQPLAGYRALPTGLVLNLDIGVTRGTLAEIGCLLDALDYFSMDPVIGAKQAHGCGKVSGRWEVETVEFDQATGRRQSHLGTLTLSAVDGLQFHGDGLKGLATEARAAWVEATQEGEFRYSEKASA